MAMPLFCTGLPSAVHPFEPCILPYQFAPFLLLIRWLKLFQIR